MLENITKMGQADRKRRYDDGCAVAQIMDIIGERWALMIIRELMFTARRFSDLRASLPGISANVLTQRLTGLEEAGIVQRRKLPPPAPAQVYELTPWGLEAEPLFCVIGRWAARSPRLAPAWMSVASVVLSMRTMFSSEEAGKLEASVGFRFGAESFRARVKKGALRIEPGDADGADALFNGDQNALVAVLYGGAPLALIEAEGRLAVSGDRAIAERYVRCFPLPETAPPGNLSRQEK